MPCTAENPAAVAAADHAPRLRKETILFQICAQSAPPSGDCALPPCRVVCCAHVMLLSDANGTLVGITLIAACHSIVPRQYL